MPLPRADEGDSKTVSPARALEVGSSQHRVSPLPVALSEAPGVVRYQDLKLLGEGGMGEVRLCRDVRIGREVARKMMRPETLGFADGSERFVREARVQGQLEHPVVVPVYELGEKDGVPFFTMKRVRGRTLGDVLHALEQGDTETARHFTRRRLLSAFSQICLAVDFAHTRGVLHRDLKPANVMLGDFGEVHLLDWGLARVLGVEDVVTQFGPGSAAVSSELGSGATQAGTVMGTPGYMAPEQAQGELDRLSAKTDVYALGAILFEILTLDSLHHGSNGTAMIVSTLANHEVRPSARAPGKDIAPELDALVARACAFAPEDRLPTARALSEAIEHFLDGDRDQQRRKELARGHVDAAREQIRRPWARAEAMREVTRALALVPDQPEALEILGRLLTEMPDELPAAAQEEMEASQAKARIRVAGVAAARAVTWVAFVPLVYWMGVRDWRFAGFTLVALFLSLAWALVLRTGRSGVTNRSSLGLLLLSSVALAGTGFVLSPFVLVPALAATNTLFFASHLSARARPFAALAGVVAVLAPVALEALGVLPPSFAFRDGNLELLPRLADLTPTPTLVLLLLGTAALVVTPAVLVGRLRDSLEAAEKKLFLHAWHLRALAPPVTAVGSGVLATK